MCVCSVCVCVFLHTQPEVSLSTMMNMELIVQCYDYHFLSSKVKLLQKRTELIERKKVLVLEFADLITGISYLFNFDYDS